MPSSRVHPDVKGMVVVVDVIRPLAQETVSPSPTTALAVERLEIDVNAVPCNTTADTLLTDVAVALQEMQLTMCVSLQAAALASGRVLPPVSWIQEAVRVNDSSDLDRRQASVTPFLRRRYAAAVRHAQNSVDSRQMPTAAPPLSSSLVLRIGSDYVVEDMAGHPSPATTVWSVVPQSMEAASSVAGKAPAQAALPITSSLHLLTRDPASEGVAVEAHGALHAPLAALPSPSRGSAATMMAAPSRVPDGDLLPGSQTTVASAAVKRATADISQDGCLSMPSLTVDSTAPPPLPQQQPPAPVMSLKDADAVASGHLQAHQAQMLPRDAQRCDDSPNASTSVAAPAEERSRLQRTLSRTAAETAVQAEVKRLQAEHVLTGEHGEGGAASATRRGAGANLSDAASGDAYSGTAIHTAGRQDGGSASDTLSPPRLRAHWLAAVREEIGAYEREAATLRRATEKARQWRESTKQELREEIARLEREAVQPRAALGERDVLRRRVEQLEAQLAGAKAVKASPLATQGTAAVLPPASADAQRAKRDCRATSGSAKSHRPCVTAVAAMPALECFSDTSALGHGDSSEQLSPPPLPEPALPPPSQACRSAPRGNGHTAEFSMGAHRWSGRRVLLTYCDRAAAPTASAAYPLPEAQRQPSPSRSGLGMERSFLSPSLEAEVRGALESDDDDAGSSVTDSRNNGTASAEARVGGGSGCDCDTIAGRGAKAGRQPPAVGTRRRRQRSTATASPTAGDASSEMLTASWMTVDAAAPAAACSAVGATSFCKAVRTASSPYPASLSAVSPRPHRAGAAAFTVLACSSGGGEDATRQGVGTYRQPGRGMANMTATASAAGCSATAVHRGLTGRHFARIALGRGDVTSLPMDASSVRDNSRRGPGRGGSPSRRLGHGYLSPSWRTPSSS
ncbi:hypothetical protein, unknown function [Leishmania mexicana MHOM/GT/2001/U1103]|uniref:Uncharacterized protein n=1 Tax=Leishmania mexicana (strain MHOM/GT/2001/U1103) TaxID=929439 RepID=E9AR90_LEIMU|nr:hypothetical protein, unknown function [Leishmania mexicana MHOM/GT/2001/U1103]CBZ25477.1 hypothetical protein, unknown function [Leishmania mexicana MHOM/GT/2001/U1103]